MSELDIVLESYRDLFGVKTDRANEIHRLACEEVVRLREATQLENKIAEMQKDLEQGFMVGAYARLKQLQETEERAERMEAALEAISAWGDAYPLIVFPEPDFKKVRELLEAGGITLGCVSASNMRHVVEGVAKIAREGLGEKKNVSRSLVCECGSLYGVHEKFCPKYKSAGALNEENL